MKSFASTLAATVIALLLPLISLADLPAGSLEFGSEPRVGTVMTLVLTLADGTELRAITSPGSVVSLESEDLGIELEMEPRWDGPSGASVLVFQVEENSDGISQRRLVETADLWAGSPSFVGPVSSLVRVELESLSSLEKSAKPPASPTPESEDGTQLVVERLRPIERNACCVTCGKVTACCSTGGCACAIYLSCGRCCSGTCC